MTKTARSVFRTALKTGPCGCGRISRRESRRDITVFGATRKRWGAKPWQQQQAWLCSAGGLVDPPLGGGGDGGGRGGGGSCGDSGRGNVVLRLAPRLLEVPLVGLLDQLVGVRCSPPPAHLGYVIARRGKRRWVA